MCDKTDAGRWKRILADAEAVEPDGAHPGYFFWRVMGGKLPSAPTFEQAVDAAIIAALEPT